MLTICDTPILLFWADNPSRLSVAALAALNLGIESAYPWFVLYLVNPGTSVTALKTENLIKNIGTSLKPCKTSCVIGLGMPTRFWEVMERIECFKQRSRFLCY